MADYNVRTKFTATIDNLSRGAKSAKASVDGVSRSTKNLTMNMGAFYNKIKTENKHFTNFTKDANRASDSVKGLSKSVGTFNQVIGMAKVSFLARGIGQAVIAATEMVETTNLFNVAMGENAFESQKFVESIKSAYGFDQTNIQSAIGTYSLLARSMGMSSDQAKVLSENTYKLAVDLSSLTNVPINQVLGDLRSGLVGQSETVYKYGLDITEATLKTEAMRLGIEKSVRNMSQGEKMALRYSSMIRQSGLAHGDFARTINTPANQMKIMTELFTTLARTIGTVFIPIIGKVLPYLNAVLMVLIDIISLIAKFFGYKAPELVKGLGENIGSIGEGFEDSTEGALNNAKKMKQVMMGFDELNVIPEDTASASGGAGVGPTVGGVTWDMEGYDNMMSTISNMSSDIKEKIEGPLKNILAIVGLIGLAFLGWKLAPLAKFIATMASDLASFVGGWQKLLGVVAIIVGFQNTVKTMLEIFDTNKPTLEQFAEALFWIGVTAGGVALAFSPIAGGVTLAIGALVLLGTYIYKYRDEIIKFAKSMGDEFKKLFGDIAQYFGEKKDRLVEMFGTMLEIFGENFNVLKGFFVGAWEGIVKTWGKLGDWFNDTVLTGFLGVVAIFDSKLTELKGFFLNAWEGIKEIWSTVGKWFTDTVITPLQTAFKGLGNFIIGIWNGVITAFESALNFIIGGINSFIRWIDSLVESVNKISEKIGISINFNMSPIEPVTLGRVPALARGGMLEPGQLFEAGEFGKAEAIGSYQGKTTVMPLENTDFVQSIYSAVKDAISDSTGGGGNMPPIVLELDGEVVYKNQQKVAQKRGYNFGLGVFSR